MYFWFLLAIGILATVAFLVLRVKKGGIPALYAKAVASVCFIAVGIAAINRNPSFLRFGSFMIFGLICGLLGDVWLDLKWIYLKDKDSFLYAGFLFFLVGHIAFVSAACSVSAITFKLAFSAVALALLIACIALFLEKPLKMQYGKFKTIVFFYTFTLSLTMTSAFVLMLATRFKLMWMLMFLGGLLFLLSDLVLSGMYFAEGKNTKGNIILNHTLYYAAQFTLASVIFFAN